RRPRRRPVRPGTAGRRSQRRSAGQRAERISVMTSASQQAPGGAAKALTLPARRTGPAGRPGGLPPAEWTKSRSVRSTLWTLALFVVITIGLTAGFTALIVANWNAPGSARNNGHVQILADPVGFILGTGIFLGQLTICVLGVLVMTTEYSTGVIR